MKDPPRLRDPDGGAPAELRALFEAGARDLPSPGELARLAGRLDPVLRAPPGSGAAAAGKAVAVLALVIGGAIGVASSFGDEEPVSPAATPAEPREPPHLEKPPEPAPPAELSAPAGPSSEPPTIDSAERDLGGSESAESQRQQRSRARPAAPATESEAALLERARRALGSDPARALALTNEHKARFANGVLVQEREVIAIEALRKLGRDAQSERRATDFGERYPDSAHRRKLDGGVP